MAQEILKVFCTSPISFAAYTEVDRTKQTKPRKGNRLHVIPIPEYERGISVFANFYNRST